MAEVFSNSPCMLGKRVLSPHSSHGLVGQLDFSSKKRRFALGSDQGEGELVLTWEFLSVENAHPESRSMPHLSCALSTQRLGKESKYAIYFLP